MLHRALLALPWSEYSPGEPPELPNVLREDLLVMALVDPYSVFATWQISYSTQNHLSDLLGESVFDQCRLILRVQSNADEEIYQEEDVSGPSQSTYISLGQRHSMVARELLVWSQLGYQDTEGNFYAIARSTLLLVPHNRLAPGAPGEWAPEEEIYERLYRRTTVSRERNRLRFTVMGLAERIDEALGRDKMSARMRKSQ